MAQHLQLDARDHAALRKLDPNFNFSDNNEIASVAGEMVVEVVRLVDADGTRLRMTLTFPNGEPLEVRIARSQLLEQLEIEADEG
jgi:hypothetical protein